MALIDFGERQVILKLVYYGPPRSGKTTNLVRLHERVAPVNKGRMMTLDTQEDRTLFFDLLPVFFKHSNLSFRVKIYTVPGQPMHEVTRRLVLQKCDGICFVADSASSMQTANRESFANLQKNLERLDLHSDRVAVVTQYNKRDLSDRVPNEAMQPFAGEDVLPAVAITGEGVVETFLRLVERTWAVVDKTWGVGERLSIDRAEFLRTISAHLLLSD